MIHPPLFAFDFSINKPAMWSLIDNALDVYIWPLDMSTKNITTLQDCGVNVHCRRLSHMKDNEYNESELICEHVSRAQKLARMIADEMESILNERCGGYKDVIGGAFVANEGFAFSSKGDAVLDLSGYKYILMAELYNRGYRNFKTYSPITIKATAGCSKKADKSKDKMIEALGRELPDLHPIIHTLSTDATILKAKTRYIECMDDMADAYWCMRTLVKKEKIEGIAIWPKA